MFIPKTMIEAFLALPWSPIFTYKLWQGGLTPERVGDILEQILPRRDQDMRERTDELITMKTREIERLNGLIGEKSDTIGQLTGR